MNLLDQSVIKKGKSAAAQRKAAPNRAPLLPSGLPSVGSPRVRPPAGLPPARREALAAVPGEIKTKAVGPAEPARPSVPGPLLSLGRYRCRRSFLVPRGPDGRTLLSGSPGAHSAGGRVRFACKARGCPGGARRQLPVLSVLAVLPVPPPLGRSPVPRGGGGSAGLEPLHTGPFGRAGTEGKDAFNGDEKWRGFGAGAARPCSRERAAAPHLGKTRVCGDPLCRSRTEASLRDRRGGTAFPSGAGAGNGAAGRGPARPLRCPGSGSAPFL